MQTLHEITHFRGRKLACGLHDEFRQIKHFHFQRADSKATKYSSNEEFTFKISRFVIDLSVNT